MVAAPAAAIEDAARLVPDAVLVAGGGTRQQSVARALTAVPAEVDPVLVHDAARAFVPAEVIDRVVTALDAGADGAVPTLPVSDTIRTVDPARGSSVNSSTGPACSRCRRRRDSGATSSPRPTPRPAARRDRRRGPRRGARWPGDRGAWPRAGIQGHDPARSGAGRGAIAVTELRTGIGVDVHPDRGRPATCWLAGLLWPDVDGCCRALRRRRRRARAVRRAAVRRPVWAISARCSGPSTALGRTRRG